MYDLMMMGTAEAKHLREFAEQWATYGPAMKAWAALDGGMTWKNVNGAEYLARYRQDPETGKKQFVSLGRRSPETEALYKRFIESRAVAKNIVISNRDRIAVAGRIAKAYSLARMPTKAANVLRSLWRCSLDEHLALFGGDALYAYEIESGVLAPKKLVGEGPLSLVAREETGFTMAEDVAGAIEDAVGERPRVREDDDCLSFRFGGTVVMEIFNRGHFVDRMTDAEQADILADVIKMPTIQGLTVARDAQPVAFSAFDPRAYALLAHALRHDDEIWDERARFAAALVRERWPEQFAPGQAAAFPELCGSSEEGELRYRGP